MTVPKQIRDALNLQAGDHVERVVQPSGEVIMRGEAGPGRPVAGSD
jgi:AbrB family looped-hinge helix DNA binding protein